jgi:hypothetical protein
MSKAVKQVVGIVAAIAIPFAAPAIAASIGLSGVIGATAGSALVGAGLGAANAAVTGGNVGRGALLGGIGGGIIGYNTPTVYLGTPAPVYDVSAAGQVVPAAGYGAPALPGAEAGLTGVPEAAFGAGAPPPATTSGISSGFTPAPAGATPGFTSGMEAAALENPAVSGFGTTQAAPVAAATPTMSPTAGLDMGSQTAAQTSASFQQQMTNAGVASRPATFTEALKRVPGEVAARFRDPTALADITLRAAGMLAGSAIAGDGLSDEEKELLRAQTEELRAIQQTNQALFNQRLEQAQNLLGESKYFDPEYFGLQRARREQLAGAKVKAAGLRGLEGPRRESESRRYDLATARNIGTAYDQGYGEGVGKRLQTMQAGLSAMPGYMSATTPAISAQMAGLGTGYLRARERQQDIGDLFGSITGQAQSRGRG